jgi:hypothetical protein
MSVTNILRFPGQAEKPSPPPPAPLPPLDTFDAEHTRTLGSILGTALHEAKVLVDFVHQDRAAASRAGMEGVGVEIAALLDSDKFSKMKTALFEAVRLGDGVTLTHDGLARLHRLEALVAEGTRLLGKNKFKEVEAQAERKPLVSLISGPALSQEKKPVADTVLLGAILMMGIVAITVTAFLLTKGQSAHRGQEVNLK